MNETAESRIPRVSSLPTPGLLVKGCLDQCNICEETLMQEMALDLTRDQLQNGAPQETDRPAGEIAEIPLLPRKR